MGYNILVEDVLVKVSSPSDPSVPKEKEVDEQPLLGALAYWCEPHQPAESHENEWKITNDELLKTAVGLITYYEKD